MTIAHIDNLEPGLSVRTKLNQVIDVANTPPVVDTGITQLTGDVAAGPGNGSQISTLASVIAAGGPIGDATHTPVISWDAKGRLTAVSSAVISGGGGGMAIGGAVTGATAGSVLFVDGSSDLAQDNANLFWDDSLHNLHISNSYFIGTSRAIFTIPNVSGNNWFEGAAGNAAVTGYRNFGTGDGALALLTSGTDNVAVGRAALSNATSAYQNLAMGSGAMQYTQLDGNNIAIGFNALGTLGYGGSGGGSNTGNIAIGLGTLGNAAGANNCVALGYSSMTNIVGSGNANFSVVIGSGAVSYANFCTSSTFIGTNCGLNLTGANSCTWIGGYQGPSANINSIIVIADGSGHYLLDYALTTQQVLSVAAGYGVYSAGLHLYNLQSSPGVASNYERGICDWNVTANVFMIGTQAGGTGVKRLTAIDGFAKAGAPAAGDLPSGSFAVIDDTSGNQTWLVFNKGGTIRKVQLV